MDTPKRQLSERQLKALAENRKRALETRQMKAELKKVKEREKKEALKAEYETKVLGKVSQPKTEAKTEPSVEETDVEIYKQAPKPEPPSDDDDDFPIELVKASKPLPKPKAQAKPKAPTPSAEPNYKQEYYRLKLASLQQSQQQQQFYNQYSQLPPHAHAVDIAKHQITNKVNKDVLDRVYKELFSL